MKQTVLFFPSSPRKGDSAMLASVKDNLFMVLFANFIASNKYLDLEK